MVTPEKNEKALNRQNLPLFFTEYYKHFTRWTPIQEKAIKAGLLEGKSLLACAPTASGKTLIATLAIVSALEAQRKALYLVPLKALAAEKVREYQALFSATAYRAVQAVGDVDAPEEHLGEADVLVLTTEKLDALLRHRASWIAAVQTIIIDEIHLLNEPKRGPTLEIIITLLKRQLPKAQVLGLSATIGNPQELAKWLGAELVEDAWRPVELKKGIYCQEQTEYY